MITSMTFTHTRLVPTAAAATISLVLAACGSSSKPVASPSASTTTASTPTSPASTTTSASAPVLPPAVAELPAAERPQLAEFPSAHGRTLQQLGGLVKSSAQLGAATGTFTPGTRRFAFGLTASSGAFIYAPTAIYIAATPTMPAQGPFLAAADPMSVSPQYRSQQNSGPGGIQAIYSADVPVPHRGTYTVLALTRTSKGLIGSPGEIAVAASSLIPNVGQRPPAIATDKPATVHGDAALLTTRLPPEDMHAVSFSQVLGKRPVALLFSTPQFCISRICGPVTDILVQLQHKYAGRIAFIHQEVYVNNQPTKGLRPQLKAFHLETEPWLFTVNRQGVITARLEGAFGLNGATQALQAALR
jgi:hypothetical protein